MNQEQYIEHEVQLRLHDAKFKMLENKINFLISICIGGFILPVVLHALELI